MISFKNAIKKFRREGSFFKWFVKIFFNIWEIFYICFGLIVAMQGWKLCRNVYNVEKFKTKQLENEASQLNFFIQSQNQIKAKQGTLLVTMQDWRKRAEFIIYLMSLVSSTHYRKQAK